jgi:hypothetical protein
LFYCCTVLFVCLFFSMYIIFGFCILILPRTFGMNLEWEIKWLSNFSAISWREQVNCQWADDEMYIINQFTYLDPSVILSARSNNIKQNKQRTPVTVGVALYECLCHFVLLLYCFICLLVFFYVYYFWLLHPDFA